MNPRRKAFQNRKTLKVDPRFELKIGGFVNSRLEISPPKTTRGRSCEYKHVNFDPTKSKMNLKFDESTYPEEIIAMQTYGYACAHQKYIENIAASYQKQWDDEERLRKCRSARRMKYPTDPIKRRKDNQILEKVIHDSKKRERTLRANSQRIAQMEPLPPEERIMGRTSRRVFYHG